MRKRVDGERLYHRFRPLPEMCDEGLVFGRGTVLARCALAPDDRSISDADGERIAALLAIVGGHRSGATIRKFVARSAARWQAGDAALAQIELAFAQLPRLASDADAYRLFLAEAVLADGMAPKELVQALGLDQDLLKYDPSQPRVPAGSGRASGQWSGGDTFVEGRSASNASVDPGKRIGIFAADGVFTTGRLVPALVANPNPLDPDKLNQGKIISHQEYQAIADTLNTIRRGDQKELKALEPHAFKNFPDLKTGAVMPPSVSGYVSYDVDLGQSTRGKGRIIINNDNNDAFYTNNHYLSYYHLSVGGYRKVRR